MQSGSTLTNNGQVNITGNLVNNQTMSAANAGTLSFTGNAAQTLSGAAMYVAKNVQVNNSNGVALSTALKIDGVCNFVNGVVINTNSANAVIFTTNASISNTNKAKDVSHINGFVVKEGTGIFSYPVGDGTRYQKIDVNLSANAGGMRVKYNATDAGTGVFTTDGTEATALETYNPNEYWDVTPVTTATGAVTVYWDGYKDGLSNLVSQRKVAHKTGGNWLNEGTTATGTTSIGSVTSNSVSVWSPFTLGAVPSTLPVKWINIQANLNTNKHAVLKWQVQESNVAIYEIEKSRNGLSFSTIATVTSKGDGINQYSHTDADAINSVTYYRIKQIDRDGKFGYSIVLQLNSQTNSSLLVYPTLFNNGITVVSSKAQAAVITNAQGQIVKTIVLNEGNNFIHTAGFDSGFYMLKATDGSTQKLMKQ
jgi:hypothetical protein